MVKHLGIAVALVSLLGSLPAVYAASVPPKELQPAIKAYNSRDYKGAVQLLGKISSPNANNEYTHYYRAMAYQGMHHYAEAKNEYMWDYEHAKDATLKYQAWQGLQGLARVSASVGAASSLLSAASGSCAPITGVAGNLSGDAAQAAAAMNINPNGAASESPKGSSAFKFQYEWKAGCPRHQ